MRPLHGLTSRFRQDLRRLARQVATERGGASAIEFALILPVLIGLYLGAVEINNALTIYRRTMQVATTAADLTAQVKSVTKYDIADIQAASKSILTPYSTSPLKIVISSVVADDNNVGKVAWSCASAGAARGTGTTYKVPTGLTEANSSVIVAEVTYGFRPLVGLSTFFSPGSFNMTRTFYSRPRRSLTVKKTDNTC
ncbi:MAG: pilus assembly protein [Methyloceanibacter sp.]|uniref:TadE/TadG family type IV pilus assembly protein n=1 Tax=Methyloceanibacter sp. TaxID=1965321 RepID=UPI001D30C47D|nr:TadE/TadG family type IV pilus assembly protein [Methyloceanibacter sp.]MCB1441961.1 pilus assembly protein [Methyloceanibacter sp.]